MPWDERGGHVSWIYQISYLFPFHLFGLLLRVYQPMVLRPCSIKTLWSLYTIQLWTKQLLRYYGKLDRMAWVEYQIPCIRSDEKLNWSGCFCDSLTTLSIYGFLLVQIHYIWYEIRSILEVSWYEIKICVVLYGCWIISLANTRICDFHLYS